MNVSTRDQMIRTANTPWCPINWSHRLINVDRLLPADPRITSIQGTAAVQPRQKSIDISLQCNLPKTNQPTNPIKTRILCSTSPRLRGTQGGGEVFQLGVGINYVDYIRDQLFMPMACTAQGWAWQPSYRSDLDLRGQLPQPVAGHQVPAKGPSTIVREASTRPIRRNFSSSGQGIPYRFKDVLLGQGVM